VALSVYRLARTPRALFRPPAPAAASGIRLLAPSSRLAASHTEHDRLKVITNAFSRPRSAGWHSRTHRACRRSARARAAAAAFFLVLYPCRKTHLSARSVRTSAHGEPSVSRHHASRYWLSRRFNARRFRARSLSKATSPALCLALFRAVLAASHTGRFALRRYAALLLGLAVLYSTATTGTGNACCIAPSGWTWFICLCIKVTRTRAARQEDARMTRAYRAFSLRHHLEYGMVDFFRARHGTPCTALAAIAAG